MKGVTTPSVSIAAMVGSPMVYQSGTTRPVAPSSQVAVVVSGKDVAVSTE